MAIVATLNTELTLSTTFSSPVRDYTRHFIIVACSNAGGTGHRIGPAPTINGAAVTTILQTWSTVYDDGQAMGVYLMRATSGVSFTVAVPGLIAGSSLVVWEVFGIKDIAAAMGTIVQARETDGGNHGMSQTSIVATTTTNSMVLVGGMRNGGASVTTDPTGKLDVTYDMTIAGVADFLLGFDTNPGAATTTYTWATWTSPAMMWAIPINLLKV